MRRLLLILLISAAPITAFALPFTLDFTATNFGPGAPFATVSGSLSFEAASMNSPVDALTSIDLTFGDAQFTLANTAFLNFNALNVVSFFGAPDSNMALGVNDFRLTWFYDALTPSQFAYTTSLAPTGFFTTSFVADFTTFVVSAATPSTAVPEPGTLALLGFGLIGLAAARRRRTEPDSPKLRS